MREKDALPGSAGSPAPPGPLENEAFLRICGIDWRASSFENDMRFEKESRGPAAGFRNERTRRAGGGGSPLSGM